MKKEDIWENIKKILKQCFGKERNEQYHAIFMLVIFGVFILVLSILLRSVPTDNNSKSPSNPSPSETPTVTKKPSTTSPTTTPKENVSFDVNYSYVFTIMNNGTKEMFTGKRIDEKEIFTYVTSTTSGNYAKLSNNYLKKENGTYHIVDSPSSNLKYTNIDTIMGLIEAASLTKSDNIYTYTVPTSKVLTTYQSNKLVEASVCDKIVATVVNNQVKTINVDFSNYATVINGNVPTTLTVNMEFNDIGTTENFEIDF